MAFRRSNTVEQAWDGRERRALGKNRDAGKQAQQPGIEAGISMRVNDAIKSDGFPLRLGADTAWLPQFQGPDFARFLKAMRSPKVPQGLLLTFHGAHPDVGDEAKLEAIDEQGTLLADEVGQPFPSPTDMRSEVLPPLTPDKVSSIVVRKLELAVGEPLSPDDVLYKKLKGATDPDEGLGFGHPEQGIIRTVGMVTLKFDNRDDVEAWNDAEILPLHEIAISPNAQALHYGTALFEGMTAEWGADGRCYVYGIRGHWERMARGAQRLGLEVVPYEIFERAVIRMVQQNARFIPSNGRLYLRPHEADLDPKMRVGNSFFTTFLLEATPIGSLESYFGEPKRDSQGHVKGMGLAIPMGETRAGTGGVGWTKGAMNYAPTTEVIYEAKKLRLDEGTEEVDAIRPGGVLFLDRPIKGLLPEEQRKARIRETNASNFFFVEVIDSEQPLVDPEDPSKPNVSNFRIVFPPTEDDVLDSHTRHLIMRKAEESGFEVIERHVTLGEVMDGQFCEAGHCGTAAMIAQCDWLSFADLHPEDPSRPDSRWIAENVGDRIMIRSQERMDTNPIPPVIKFLRPVLSDVKSARSTNPKDQALLTHVPGIRLKRNITGSD